LLAHTPDQLGKARLHEGGALGNLIFPGRIKKLIGEIELWRNNRAWYLSKGIPWKRGWMLYGPPGTGKTALARAFAEDLNMPIYVFNLAQMSNHELMKAWTDMQVNVPCIALIEDIDNVFHGRENVARKGMGMSMMFARRSSGDDDNKSDMTPLTPLTFDCLLNCLDGVERSDGIFTIITTNDISKIDPALGKPRKLPDGTVEFISTRPGRIDKAVELTYMEAEDKKRMAQRILDEYPVQCEEMIEFVDRYPDLEETPAQFQERCGQIALACFWKETHGGKETVPAKEEEFPEYVTTGEEPEWLMAVFRN
jgi:SpoVK/Ycf46/Vps4 family AAA+-type ATPase